MTYTIKICLALLFVTLGNAASAQVGKKDSIPVSVLVKDLNMSVTQVGKLKELFKDFRGRIDSIVKDTGLITSERILILGGLYAERELKIKLLLNEQQQERLKLAMLKYTHKIRREHLEQRKNERRLLIEQRKELNTDTNLKTKKNGTL